MSIRENRSRAFARAAREKMIALWDTLSAAPEQIASIDLAAAYCINGEERPLDEMLANTAANLEKTTAALPI
jgi:glycerate kinase